MTRFGISYELKDKVRRKSDRKMFRGSIGSKTEKLPYFTSAIQVTIIDQSAWKFAWGNGLVWGSSLQIGMVIG